jgi:hypothetical protein
MNLLSQLNAKLFVVENGNTFSWEPKVERIADADGIWFDCPCGHGGSQMVSFRGNRADGTPRPAMSNGRAWQVSGSTLADITLTPSINTRCWHGFIENGNIRTV